MLRTAHLSEGLFGGELGQLFDGVVHGNVLVEVLNGFCSQRLPMLLIKCVSGAFRLASPVSCSEKVFPKRNGEDFTESPFCRSDGPAVSPEAPPPGVFSLRGVLALDSWAIA